MASTVAQLQAALDAKQAELEAEQEASQLASAKALLQVADAEKAKLEAENKQLRAEAAQAKADAALAAAEAKAAADPVHRTLQQMAALQQHLLESPSGSQDLLKGVHELKLNPEQEGSLREWQMFERDMLRYLKEHAEFCVERNARAFKQQHATVPAAQWQQDDVVPLRRRPVFR